jgi:hypothetical protein
VLARVRDGLAAARQRVEGQGLVGGEGGSSLGIAGVGRRLRSLSGGMSMAEAFTTFPEQAAAVLLGGPLAAGVEEDDEDEDEGTEEEDEDATDAEAWEDDEDGGAFSASAAAAAASALLDAPMQQPQPPPPPPQQQQQQHAAWGLGLVESILGASPAPCPTALRSSHSLSSGSTSSRGGTVSPSRARCGCFPPCAVSRRGAHFLVPACAAAAAAASSASGAPCASLCPEGLHLGTKRAVLDLVTGEWLSWRSCCGQLRCEQRAAAAAAAGWAPPLVVAGAGMGVEEDMGWVGGRMDGWGVEPPDDREYS